MSVLCFTREFSQGESVETFIRSLHELAEHCNKKSEDEQLVIGIRDKELSVLPKS